MFSSLRVALDGCRRRWLQSNDMCSPVDRRGTPSPLAAKLVGFHRESTRLPTIPAVPTEPKRILLIRPSALGDVCRTVPVLASLRAAFPGAAIDWLVQDTFADAVAAHPALTSVVPFRRNTLSHDLKQIRFGSSLAFLDELRRARYDLAIDAQGLARSGLFTLATRAAIRVGYRNAQEGGRLGYNRTAQVPRDMHAVDRMLELARLAGAEPICDMRLTTPSNAAQWAEAQPELAAPIVLAPTSRWAGKRWPIERFADLALRLLAEQPRPIVIVGSPGEEPQVAPLLERVGSDPRVRDLVGQTTIAKLMAIIERAALVVANDSAAVHMAVGFARPFVALYGPTDVARVGPYRRDADVIQHIEPGEPINHKDDAAGQSIMRRIGVDEVHAACAARLGLT